MRKGTNGEDGYSAFSMRDSTTHETIPTELGALLKAANVDEVVVTGLATDYCVRATALDSASLGFHTYLLTDAVAGVNLKPGDGDAAIAEMEAAGIHLTNTRVR